MVSVYAFNSSDCFLPQSLTAGPFGFGFEAEWTASSRRFNKPPLSDVTRFYGSDSTWLCPGGFMGRTTGMWGLRGQ